ncbi:uncharacterized protein BDW70DRAFT_153045 [Aspergillus foveolatus]|uniref:uncharacterized protein n=1 Tax=Aspergillus foveolatus TaxID=210207 RepID=UPI003CCC8F66
MESARLTFLNTTGASLSAAAAKRMRAHITRTNFAKRRQRIAVAGAKSESNAKRRQRGRNQTEEEDGDGAPSLTSAPCIHQIQELVFLEGRHTPGSASEAAWFNLVASEPALVEASLAVAVRQWSPDNSCQSKADYHSYTAVRLIKQRITSIATPSDGVLGAVITMALGASLVNDDIAWKIHMDGLAHIVNERVSRGLHSLPAWFIDLIIQDSINNIIGFPRVWYQSIVQILGEQRDRRIMKLAEISDSVIRLRKVIESLQVSSLNPMSVAQEIEEPLARLHYEARNLRATDNLHIDAAARSIELVLYLLWPTQSAAHLTLLAGELKELVIGAIAADKASPVRAWFVDRISKAVRWMQRRGWHDPLSVVETVIGNELDDGLVGQFKALWREIYGIE